MRAASIGLLLLACGESAAPASSVVPVSTAPASTLPAAPTPTLVERPHAAFPTVVTPVDLCGTALEPILVPLLGEEYGCGRELVSIVYRRVGIVGHDVVGVYVRDERAAAIDGPLIERRVMFVDGARASCGLAACDAITALEPTLDLPDATLAALLAIVMAAGDPELIVDDDARASFGRVNDTLTGLSTHEVGLSRDATSATLLALDPVIQSGMMGWSGQVLYRRVTLRADRSLSIGADEIYRTHTERGRTVWIEVAPGTPPEPLSPELERLLGTDDPLSDL